MSRFKILALVALAGSLGISAASSQSRATFATVSPALAQAPTKARLRQNPFEGQPEAVLAGEKLFREHCAQCHGEDGRGTGRAADLHSPVVQNATPGELEWLLRNGNLASGMPSWSGLPPQRRWQIVAYLKALR